MLERLEKEAPFFPCGVAVPRGPNILGRSDQEL